MLWMVRPRWLAAHVLFLGSAAGMILLGRWQLDVGNSGGSGEGSLLNYGYALQWWAFAACAVVFWARVIRDQLRRVAVAAGRLPASAGPDAQRALAEAPKPTPYRGYAMPQMAQITQNDPDLIAYNNYLVALNPGPGSPGKADMDEPAPAAEGER